MRGKLTLCALALAAAASGCSTWKSMDSDEKGMAAGATGGALVGGVVGGPVGAAVGAAGGGYAGKKSETIQDAVDTTHDNPRVAPGVNTGK